CVVSGQSSGARRLASTLSHQSGAGVFQLRDRSRQPPSLNLVGLLGDGIQKRRSWKTVDKQRSARAQSVFASSDAATGDREGDETNRGSTSANGAKSGYRPGPSAASLLGEIHSPGESDVIIRVARGMRAKGSSRRNPCLCCYPRRYPQGV